MKSVVMIALLPLAAAVAVGVPAGPTGGTQASVCDQMTPERLLQDPRFAKEWSDALQSGDPAAVERMHELFSHLRAMHGCDGGDAAGTPGAAAPDDALPPGHPPVGGDEPSTPGSMIFEEPSTLTI